MEEFLFVLFEKLCAVVGLLGWLGVRYLLLESWKWIGGDLSFSFFHDISRDVKRIFLKRENKFDDKYI